MEKLRFLVKGEKLIRLEIKPINSGTRNYIEAEFILNHSWYNITPIVAQFKKDNALLLVTVQNGKCIVPWEVLTSKGTIEILLTGGDLLVTNSVQITVNDSGAEGGLLSTEPSNSFYTELNLKMEAVQEDWENCKALLEEYEAKINSGKSAIDVKMYYFEDKCKSIENTLNDTRLLLEQCNTSESNAKELLQKVLDTIANAENKIQQLKAVIADGELKRQEIAIATERANNSNTTLLVTISTAESLKNEIPLEELTSQNSNARENIERLESDVLQSDVILEGLGQLATVYTAIDENNKAVEVKCNEKANRMYSLCCADTISYLNIAEEIAYLGSSYSGGCVEIYGSENNITNLIGNGEINYINLEV